MTEKRFQIIHLGNPYDFVVKDHATNKTYGTFQGDDKSLTELLNELHEENTRLQNEIQDFQNLLTEREETFLKPIYTALDDAILNERTALGKSALKQFKQTIME